MHERTVVRAGGNGGACIGAIVPPLIWEDSITLLVLGEGQIRPTKLLLPPPPSHLRFSDIPPVQGCDPNGEDLIT